MLIESNTLTTTLRRHLNKYV